MRSNNRSFTMVLPAPFLESNISTALLATQYIWECSTVTLCTFRLWVAELPASIRMHRGSTLFVVDRLKFVFRNAKLEIFLITVEPVGGVIQMPYLESSNV